MIAETLSKHGAPESTH